MFFFGRALSHRNLYLIAALPFVCYFHLVCHSPLCLPLSLSFSYSCALFAFPSATSTMTLNDCCPGAPLNRTNLEAVGGGFSSELELAENQIFDKKGGKPRHGSNCLSSIITGANALHNSVFFRIMCATHFCPT